MERDEADSGLAPSAKRARLDDGRCEPSANGQEDLPDSDNDNDDDEDPFSNLSRVREVAHHEIL